MSLAFLVPLFLAGIAGIVVPIVVHLTRRQRKNVVHFPSLMFLQKIPYQEQRRRRIQHWFLLSLRASLLPHHFHDCNNANAGCRPSYTQPCPTFRQTALTARSRRGALWEAASFRSRPRI